MKLEWKPVRPSALVLGVGVLIVVGVGMWIAPDAPWMETLVTGSIIALAGAVVKLCDDAPPGDSDEVIIAGYKHEEEMARIAAGSPPAPEITEQTAVELVKAVK